MQMASCFCIVKIHKVLNNLNYNKHKDKWEPVISAGIYIVKCLSTEIFYANLSITLFKTFLKDSRKILCKQHSQNIF